MTRLLQLRSALRLAFARPSGYVAALFGAVFVVLLTLILPNTKLLGFTLGEPGFSFGLKLRTTAEILWNGRVIFMTHGGAVALLIAVAFGMNAALVFHYMRERVRIDRAAGASAAGIVIGLLGVGCAACGSVVLTSLLGLGFVAALPFNGLEFAWLGLLVIFASTFMIAKKIVEPEACRIPAKR